MCCWGWWIQKGCSSVASSSPAFWSGNGLSHSSTPWTSTHWFCHKISEEIFVCSCANYKFTAVWKVRVHPRKCNCKVRLHPHCLFTPWWQYLTVWSASRKQHCSLCCRNGRVKPAKYIAQERWLIHMHLRCLSCCMCQHLTYAWCKYKCS